MYMDYVKVDLDKGGRQSKMAANSKSHVVARTAYAISNGDSCHLLDGMKEF